MSNLDSLDFFAETYPEARAKFLLAAAQHGGRVTSYAHQTAQGPDGGSLAMDVACFGAADAPKSYLVLSGTHGGEGYTGSAAQIALLHSGALDKLPRDTRVVLVHALNPFGFAHWTRTTENNVDLNRNFIDFGGRLPRNDNYLQLHGALCPSDWTDASRTATRNEIDAWTDEHGLQAWMQAIMMGQYDDPTGIIYGGRAPEWSRRTLESVVQIHLAGTQKLAFIDWHTGLGQFGQPFFLCFNTYRDSHWERACGWWGRERIETTDGYKGAARPTYSGLVFQGVQRQIAPGEMTGAVIEFGTIPVDQALDQIRIDRWLKFGKMSLGAEQLASMRRAARDAFTPPDPAWRRGVAAHATEIQLQGLQGVVAW
jgi:hypothetical protein